MPVCMWYPKGSVFVRILFRQLFIFSLISLCVCIYGINRCCVTMPKRQKNNCSSPKKKVAKREVETSTLSASAKTQDPFRTHFDRHLTDDELLQLCSQSRVDDRLQVPNLGTVTHSYFAIEEAGSLNLSLDVLDFHIKKSLVDNFGEIKPVESSLLAFLISYIDLLYPQRGVETAVQVRRAYCLHVLNHCLKSRLQVIHNNAVIKAAAEVDRVSLECRDQGLVRPKCLILVPFRQSVVNIVECLTTLLFGENTDKQYVQNKKRFYTNFHEELEKTPFMLECKQFLLLDEDCVSFRKKPDDYQQIFSGNTDDCFRLGISVARKSLKLFVDFYSADIIIASPLGLRTVTGTDDEKQVDFDFLSTIELLILDQADVFLMQNWQHVLHIFEHLHQQPKELHGTDVNRVRMSSLNAHSQYYRQTAIFSDILTPELRSAFNRFCKNFAGSVKIAYIPKADGMLSSVKLRLSYAFHLLPCQDPTEESDKRFDFFINKILPHYRDDSMDHTLIYVPSYYDYIRIRNYMKIEGFSFVQICEYSKKGKVAAARHLFFHGSKQFLLLSERAHFYRRYKIKGIKNLVFYQAPTYPQFYTELCNMMDQLKAIQHIDDSVSNDRTCSLIYSKFDALTLSGFLGPKMTKEILQNDQPVHIISND